MSYAHLKTPQNQGSGLSDTFLFAPVSYFEEEGIKCPDPAATTLETQTVISTDHVFKTGMGFIEVICKPQKNNLAAATTGEAGSLRFNPTLTVNIPGSYAKLHGTMKTLINEPLIVLVKDPNCSSEQYYQLGCDCIFAYATSSNFATGTLSDGSKGYDLTISAPAEAIMTYTGAVLKLGTTV